MLFNYLQTTTFNADIDIEDVANCAIKTYTDLGQEYILIIDTYLGNTRIYQYGPIIAESKDIPPIVNMSMQKFQYSQKKIISAIMANLNRQGITQAFEVTKEEALEDVNNIENYMLQKEF